MSEHVLYNYRTAGKKLGVSHATVYRLVRDGLLHTVYLGKSRRIPHTEIVRLSTPEHQK